MLIDAHAHIIRLDALKYTPPPGIKGTDVDLFLAEHDEAGFEKIILVAQSMERVHDSWIPVEPIIELKDKYPKKIMGLTSTEPLDKQGKFNTKGLEFFEKSIKEWGLNGMMWSPGYGHWYPNDKAAYPFYELAVEMDVPIYFHLATWWPNPMDHPLRYGRPHLLDDVIIDFPDLKINIEHMNYPNSDEILAIMSRSKNVYSDTAFLLSEHNPLAHKTYLRGTTILTFNLVKAKELGVIDKIMYGTDYAFSEPVDLKREVHWFRELLNEKSEKCGWETFTEEEIEGILGNNAKKFYDIK